MKTDARSWDWPLQHKDGLVSLVNNSQRFEAGLEVAMFKAEEIDVHVINDGIVVRCRNDNDAARLKRSVQRAYQLPKDVDTKTIKSSIKSDGSLQITATKRRLF